LCAPQAETVLWRDAHCRIVAVDDSDYPGYCRVVWNAHVREMTDLDHAGRNRLMAVVFTVEEVLRELLRPDKVNLGSLGNRVPHLHWHVIARFADDPHFPDAIWAAPRRASVPRRVDPAALEQALAWRLSGLMQPTQANKN
jgi:diadenosine tetraphosphate (Ap4A) HIT family hydrolase